MLLNRQTDETNGQTDRQISSNEEKFSWYDLQQDHVIFNLSLVLLDRQTDRQTENLHLRTYL